MSTWIIILISLWLYPFITQYLISRSRNNNKLRQRIIILIFAWVLTTTLALLTNVSTTSIEIDWIFITSYYFLICIALWLIVERKNKWIKVFGYTFMVIIFGFGYISGTVGILGVGFITAEHVPRTIEVLDNGLTYKETGLGNAISDYRGVRIEIYKTYRFLPFLERELSFNEYYGMEFARYPVTYNYDKQTGILNLTLDTTDSDELINWNEQIKLSE